MRYFIRLSVLAVFSFVALYFMYSKNILDFNLLTSAFSENKKIIFVIAFIQMLNCLFMSLRYYSILNIFKIKTKFRNAVAATYVGNGLGLWLPGSMAIIELIRITLMIGENKRNFLNDKNNEDTMDLTFKSRLAAVSLFDRLIGLFVMLFIGLFVIMYSIYKGYLLNSTYSTNLVILFFITFILLLGIFLSPFVANILFFRKCLKNIENYLMDIFNFPFAKRILTSFFREITHLLDAIKLGGQNIGEFWLSFVYSLMCLVLSVFGTYYASIAVFSEIPFAAIFATVSMLAIVSLLPIGFGGVGGMQLFAVFLFSLFGVAPKAASAANLLQTSVNLLAISIVGLCFARLSIKQIRAIVHSKKKEKLVSQ